MPFRAAIKRTTDDNLREKIRDCLEWVDWKNSIFPDSRIYIKPNLTFPEYRPGVTTSPRFIVALLDVLKERTPHLTVIEADGGNNSYPAEKAFETHNLYEICGDRNVRLINITNEEKIYIEVPGDGKRYPPIPLSKEIAENADMTISAPVPKMHFVTRFTGAVKNHWGCVADSMRLRNHFFFRHAINKIIEVYKSRIAVIDGEYFLDINGPVFGEPVKMDLVMAADSPYTADIALMDLMDVDPARICYIRQAWKLNRGPRTPVQIEFNTNPAQFKTHNFKYRRDPFDYLALLGFHSKLITYLVYLSPFREWMHRIVRFMRSGSRQVDEYYTGIVDPNEPG